MSLKSKVKGFTLIELMIVVAIIGILAAVAIPKFADLVTKSKEASTKGSLGAVRSAMSIYYGDTDGLNVGNLYTSLTSANKYLPTLAGVASLGRYEVPKNNNGLATAHDTALFKNASTSGAVLQTGALPGNGGDGTNAIWYNATMGEAYINCTHSDSKSLIWTTY